MQTGAAARRLSTPPPGTGKPPPHQSPRQDDEDYNFSSCRLQREKTGPLLTGCWVTECLVILGVRKGQGPLAGAGRAS